ncbi:MAG: hypothetical protein J6D20_06575 [Clostridia bacterium]|nr:hypothetical protein [Clostridia bacterium]
MKTREEILTKERLEYVRACRNASRESAFAEVKDKIGEAASAELKKLYDIFDEKIYIWLSGLWDRDCGAFYYSESARDTSPYLPDIESTVQALRFLNNSGMIRAGEGNYINRIPVEVREGIVNFALSLQDDDGYFYHPQWGKNISASRRGRDLSWGKNTLKEAGVTPRYMLPTAKTSDGKRSEHLPDYLKSIDAFKKYLDGMDITNNSYYVGNVIESTMSLISAAGEEYTNYLAEWLNSKNRSDNGLWEEEIKYSSVNGLMKMSGNYPAMRVGLPHAAASLKSAIFAVMSDERMKFVCEVYNPWATIVNVFRANGNAQENGELDILRRQLIDNAPALIAKTAEKIGVFRKSDGSYSYFKTMSSAISQGSPVAVPRTNEGDVNATTICVGSTTRCMRSALGLPAIPIYAPEDGELFFELLMCSSVVEKKYNLDYFPEKPSDEEELGE